MPSVTPATARSRLPRIDDMCASTERLSSKQAGRGTSMAVSSWMSGMLQYYQDYPVAVTAAPSGVTMSRTRVHNLFVSADGYAAGDHVTFEKPIGDAAALFSRFDGRVIHGVQGADAPVTVDRALFSMWGQGIGAEIMGRKKFGPQTGEWPDDGWEGWWGDAPPFLTPVFVMTHYPREPLEFENGTSFRFTDAPPADVLRMAQEAAGGLDVRLGGGPSTVNQFLQEDLVDFLHLAIVPVVLGAGVRIWDRLAGLEDRFDVETIGTESGLTHQLWNRKPRT